MVLNHGNGVVVIVVAVVFVFVAVVCITIVFVVTHGTCSGTYARLSWPQGGFRQLALNGTMASFRLNTNEKVYYRKGKTPLGMG